jgi:hypothetical protein
MHPGARPARLSFCAVRALEALAAGRSTRALDRMNDTRSTVRRIIQVLALLAGILTPYITGRAAQMVANLTPIVTGAIHYSRIPLATTFALGLVPNLPAIGAATAAALAVATVVLFKLSKDEDTRMQGTVVIAVAGYAVALTLLMEVAFCLVALPGAFNAV